MEVYMNPKDIEMLIELYNERNENFVLKSFIDNKTPARCICYVDGQECMIDFYIKKDGKIKIMPVGKNVHAANKLITFIKENTLDASIDSQTCVIECEQTIFENLIEYFENDCKELVSIVKNDKNVKFKGYNGDMVTCAYYTKSSKLVIQAKPLATFGLIITFLSQLDVIDMDNIIEVTNVVSNQKISQEAIREEMKRILKKSYDYLDEALRKSIAGSLILLKRKDYSEDYSGYLTGEFKALEGYLKKVLTQKFEYKFDRKSSFSMFYKDDSRLSAIDKDANISSTEKDALNKLYRIYQNKRNVYLHSTIDPSQTKVVENICEVQELSSQILTTIEETYNLFFQLDKEEE